jgi:hypothetical protein
MRFWIGGAGDLSFSLLIVACCFDAWTTDYVQYSIIQCCFLALERDVFLVENREKKRKDGRRKIKDRKARQTDRYIKTET